MIEDQAGTDTAQRASTLLLQKVKQETANYHAGLCIPQLFVVHTGMSYKTLTGADANWVKTNLTTKLNENAWFMEILPVLVKSFTVHQGASTVASGYASIGKSDGTAAAGGTSHTYCQAYQRMSRMSPLAGGHRLLRVAGIVLIPWQCWMH